MKLTSNQRRGAALGIVGLIGWFSGTWLPPETVADILGAFV